MLAAGRLNGLMQDFKQIRIICQFTAFPSVYFWFLLRQESSLNPEPFGNWLELSFVPVGPLRPLILLPPQPFSSMMLRPVSHKEAEGLRGHLRPPLGPGWGPRWGRRWGWDGDRDGDRDGDGDGDAVPAASPRLCPPPGFAPHAPTPSSSPRPQHGRPSET